MEIESAIADARTRHQADAQTEWHDDRALAAHLDRGALLRVVDSLIDAVAVHSTTVLSASMNLEAIEAALAAAGLDRRFRVRECSRGDRLVDLLRARAGRPIGELAEEVYGANTLSGRGKVRALLAQLGRAGKLRNTGRGIWEAVAGRAVDRGVTVAEKRRHRCHPMRPPTEAP